MRRHLSRGKNNRLPHGRRCLPTAHVYLWPSSSLGTDPLEPIYIMHLLPACILLARLAVQNSRSSLLLSSQQSWGGQKPGLLWSRLGDGKKGNSPSSPLSPLTLHPEPTQSLLSRHNRKTSVHSFWKTVAFHYKQSSSSYGQFGVIVEGKSSLSKPTPIENSSRPHEETMKVSSRT